MGFVLFYPLPASRRELLWELTSQEFGSDNSVYGMKMLVLANRLCEVRSCIVSPPLPNRLSPQAIKQALKTRFTVL